MPGRFGRRLFTKVNRAGDINRDYVDDIVIGHDWVGGLVGSGIVFVVFGRDSTARNVFPTFVDLSSLDATSGLAFAGLGDNDGLGVPVGRVSTLTTMGSAAWYLVRGQPVHRVW